MADTIVSRKDELSGFPQRRDTFPNYQDGNRKANVTDAEIVNKIEAVILKTQEHAQRTVRVAENASAGGDRKRLLLGNVAYNNVARDTWQYTFELDSLQLAWVGGNVNRPGIMFLPSVYAFADFGDATPVRCRCYVLLHPPNRIEVFFDHVDPSNKLKAGYFYVKLAIFAY